MKTNLDDDKASYSTTCHVPYGCGPLSTCHPGCHQLPAASCKPLSRTPNSASMPIVDLQPPHASEQRTTVTFGAVDILIRVSSVLHYSILAHLPSIGSRDEECLRVVL